MATTASAIIDTVRTTVNHSALSDTQVLVHINNTQRQATRRYPYSFFENVIAVTVPTSGDVNVPHRAFYAVDYESTSTASPTTVSRVKAIDAIFIQASGVETIVPHGPNYFALVDSYAGATAAQQPDYWSRYGTSYFFFPDLSSAATAIVYYQHVVADLATVTGTNDLVRGAAELLEYGAVAEYYDSIGEMGRAATYHRKHDAALKLILDQHRSGGERSRNPVPVTPGTIVATARRKPRGWTWS